MSQDDLLSQEEIDALLKGVSGDEEPSPACLLYTSPSPRD